MASASDQAETPARVSAGTAQPALTMAGQAMTDKGCETQ
nr:MAG TPA: hypothetical protein [Caudoviricetes sp.]